ncbi:MAG: 2-succinyl-5-enolpyruvyl-6-hydroxy-3-cyclohexene-1-carboxylic-acid synthase [Rhodothermia bacterium]|nr:2-succinyl-5-enolpyruvyl-6-hydroxy-3-cyclohexene-1-carboxylic-acid synthase [Rhodothermia bacterium]
MNSEGEHIGQYWAQLAVEELIRNGVYRFYVAPGSRSSPLAVAISRSARASASVHFDERGAAFAALGWARGSGLPAAVVTTSGTAVANCLPAVVEAAVDAIPLVVVTADRPPELRSSGANQTIRQPDIFGSYPRWSVDVPVATHDIDPAFILTTIDQAVYRAVETPGPVHINWMFREPLAPGPDAGFGMPGSVSLGRWLDHDRPFTQYGKTSQEPTPSSVKLATESILRSERGAIVAGRLRSAADVDATLALAAQLGWPVLADVLSNIPETQGVQVVRRLELLLKSEALRSKLQPDCVIHVGARVTAKALYEHLESCAPRDVIMVAPHPERIDPMHRVTFRIESEAAGFCDAIVRAMGELPNTTGSCWPGIGEVEEGIRSVLDLRAKKSLTEPGVADAIGRLLPSGHDVFVGSSMPIRDLDMFGWPLRDGRYTANRGASGIDGTVASAVGFATARGRPLTLLIGDLALLHDLNSLDLVRRSTRPITIVVVNNDGGGVFSFLPIAKLGPGFETFFGTPHGLSFEHAAKQFDIPYACPETSDEFGRAMQSPSASGKSRMIEVRTDRQSNHALHLEIYEAVDSIAAQVASVVSRP